MALQLKKLSLHLSNMEKGFETPFLTLNHQAGVRKGAGFLFDDFHCPQQTEMIRRIESFVFFEFLISDDFGFVRSEVFRFDENPVQSAAFLIWE